MWSLNYLVFLFFYFSQEFIGLVSQYFGLFLCSYQENLGHSHQNADGFRSNYAPWMFHNDAEVQFLSLHGFKNQ